ncbi:hypothetical protein SOPP22_11415 [Shewanella sp. OPT22]|nr:hypothetical protein SOPP22_11415 [Shewanella sp. OPT22]
MNLKAMENYRTKYRSEVGRFYNGWVHMLSVAIVGILAISYFISQVNQPTLLEWLTLPITILCVNFAEYAAHRWLGHVRTKIGGLFYSRHTGDHHSFFIEDNMPYQSVRDWRVVLFPTYLIFAFLIGLILPMGALLYFVFSANVTFLMAIGGIFGYLFYEVMHFSYHLPNGSFVEKVPVWRELRQLHNLHHRRSIMAKENFNITLPIFDFLLGTLYWEKPRVR